MDSIETVIVRADRIRDALFLPEKTELLFCYTTSEEPASKPLAGVYLPGNMVSHHGSTEA